MTDCRDLPSPSTKLSGNRNHSLKNAAGKDDGNHVMTYSSGDILAHPDVQLTQGGLVLAGVLCGGDYSKGLHGCGVQIAYGLAKAGFGDTLLRAARTLTRPDLEVFLVGWRDELCAELKTNAKGRLPRKSPRLAKTVPKNFPHVDAVLAYTNPVTSEEKGRQHRNAIVDWDKEPDLGRIAGLCEMYFEWGVRQVIIKRFRTVLWPSAVLRILRCAAVLMDRQAAMRAVGHPQVPPETPRKNGKVRRRPPGTPSSMIAKHFSGMALNSPIRGSADGGSNGGDDREDDDENPLIVKIHSSRQHASTDGILEYRLEIAPAQLVHLCEAGVKGLRTALPLGLSDEDEDEDDDDREGGGKKNTKKAKNPPLDPGRNLRLWLPACMVAMVEPEMVDEFEDLQKWKAGGKAEKGKTATAPGKVTAATATAAKKTKAKVLAATAIAKEEEESSGEDSEPSPLPNPETASASTWAESAAKRLNKLASQGITDKPSAIGGAAKIDEFFAGKEPTSKLAAARPAKAVAKSSTSKIPKMFLDLSSDSDEELRSFRRPLPAPQKASTTQPSLSQISTASSSSRILSFLDSQPKHPSTNPSKPSTSSLCTARTPQPFPMDFDVFQPSEIPMTDPIGGMFIPGSGPSSQLSSRMRPTLPSSLSSFNTSSSPLASAPVHKSPRRSKKHTSPRSREGRRSNAQQTSRKDGEEEPSESDSGPALGLGVLPSPSPLRGGWIPTVLGTTAHLSTSISISSGSEPEDKPPLKPTVELARARLAMVNADNKRPRRAYESDNVIDLT